jgi:hypothetical protein
MCSCLRNAEVVNSPALGTLVEFGDRAALTAALDDALSRAWDRERIIDYARANSWDRRVPQLLAVFDKALHGDASALEQSGELSDVRHLRHLPA